jgi:hypothetical protein
VEWYVGSEGNLGSNGNFDLDTSLDVDDDLLDDLGGSSETRYLLAYVA